MIRESSLAVSVVAMAVTAFGAVSSQPGTLSYLEGRAWVDSKPLTNVSSSQQPLRAGQVLKTDDGKAEVLLIPGTYLRLSENTAVRVISPSLTSTRLELMRGQALVDVADLRKENSIRVSAANASVALLKNGLYRFDADEQTVSVFDGKATVSQADQAVELTKGHQAALSGSTLVDRKFDRDQAKDDLYRWSKLRSEYLRAANAPPIRFMYPGWYG